MTQKQVELLGKIKDSGGAMDCGTHHGTVNSCDRRGYIQWVRGYVYALTEAGSEALKTVEV